GISWLPACTRGRRPRRRKWCSTARAWRTVPVASSRASTPRGLAPGSTWMSEPAVAGPDVENSRCSQKYPPLAPSAARSSTTAAQSKARRARPPHRPLLAIASLLRIPGPAAQERRRSEEHTSELQSRGHLVCRLLLEKKIHID